MFHISIVHGYISTNETHFSCPLYSDYVMAFCLEHGKEQLTVKEVNEAITNQVSYARKKLQRLAAK